MTLETAKTEFANFKHTWLLILDNADDIEINYEQYFPTGNTGSIIMTTRNHECLKYGGAGQETFEKLEMDDAVTLLFKASELKKEFWETHDEAAHQVVELLAQHALAINQAGASIRQGVCKLQEYSAVFQHQRKDLLEDYPVQGQSTYGSVYATFNVSVRAMETSSKREWVDALALLKILGYFYRDNVPEEMFTKAWDYSRITNDLGSHERVSRLSTWHVFHLLRVVRQQTSSRELNLFALRKAGEVLRSFSLITINPEIGAISMHPLAHAWARGRLQQDEQTTAWATASSILSLSIDGFDYQEFFRKIQSHIEFCFGLRSTECFSIYPGLEICRIFYHFFWSLYRMANDAGANEIATLLLSRVGHEILPQSRNQRVTQYISAISQKLLGKNLEAMKLLQEIVLFDNRTMDPESPDCLTAQNALAVLYNELGKYREAINLLKRVIRIRRKFLGPEHPNLLTSQHELASAYSFSRQPKKAVRLLKKVVQIRLKTLDPTNPDHLASQHILARAYTSSGQPEKAVRLLKKVVQIHRKMLDPIHPGLLASQYDLARAYLKLGQPQNALPLLQEVVRVDPEMFEPDHPDRVLSEDVLARCISDLEKQRAEASQAGLGLSNPIENRRVLGYDIHEDSEASSVALDLDELSDAESLVISETSSIEISDASSVEISDASDDAESEGDSLES